jgi:hypothetical protein
MFNDDLLSPEARSTKPPLNAGGCEMRRCWNEAMVAGICRYSGRTLDFIVTTVQILEHIVDLTGCPLQTELCLPAHYPASDVLSGGRFTILADVDDAGVANGTVILIK